MKRDLLSFSDLTRAQAERLFDVALRLKADLRAGRAHTELAGKTLAVLFHKPSLRTRLSFEVGMTQLGGSSLYITDKEIGIGAREPVQDVARVLSGYVDGVMIRTFSHQLAVDLARHATIPVINGLTDWLHPCQILADLLTMRECGIDLDEAVVAFIGDGNNVANSWIEAATLFGLTIRIACPEGYDPDSSLVARVRAGGPGRVEIHRTAASAAQGADVLYTDVWASMGQEAEREKRLREFQGYSIDSKLLALAKPAAIVLHCLPAHRGEEISDEVIEGRQSMVFLQAENRLHAQKAVIWELLEAGRGARKSAPSRAAAATKRGAPKKPAPKKAAPKRGRAVRARKSATASPARRGGGRRR